MTAILKVFTAEQYTTLFRDYVIAQNVGLTNWNVGSVNLAQAEAVGLVASTLGADMLEAIRRVAPVALYDGLNFTRKGALRATGTIRAYRLPQFTLAYTGAGTSCEVDASATLFSTTVTAIPADDLSIDLTTFTTIQAVVDEINAHPSGNYTAAVVSGNADNDSDNLFAYNGFELVGNTDYLNNTDSMGVMDSGAVQVTIAIGTPFNIDSTSYETTEAKTLEAGDDSTDSIAGRCTVSGTIGNNDALTLDTLNGKGSFNYPNIDHAINDAAFTGGQEQETNEERAARFQIRIQDLSGGGTNLGIRAAILELDQIRSVTVIEKDPEPGKNRVVADRGDGTLSASDIDEIRLILDGDPDDIENTPGVGVAGIDYNIEAPNVLGVPVTVTVKRIGTLSDENEITTAVNTAISRYINTRRLGDDVIFAELVRQVKSSHPSIFDATFTTPTANIAVADDTVPRTGISGAPITITITTEPTIP